MSRNNDKPKAKAVEMKFYPHSSTQKGPTATYATVLDHICHQIQHTYEYGQDIAESLWKVKAVDLTKYAPQLGKSTNPDKTMHAEENEQLKMLFKAELSAWVERKKTLESNIPKAYATIFQKLSPPRHEPNKTPSLKKM